MAVNTTLAKITERIIERSDGARRGYLDRMARAADTGVYRAHLSCGNQAHAYAAMGRDKDAAGGRSPNIGIVTAYNDMLSAHQPFQAFPGAIKARRARRWRHRAGRGRRAGDVRRRHPGPAGHGAVAVFPRRHRAGAGVALSPQHASTRASISASATRSCRGW